MNENKQPSFLYSYENHYKNNRNILFYLYFDVLVSFLKMKYIFYL